jgi:hypothetical protein
LVANVYTLLDIVSPASAAEWENSTIVTLTGSVFNAITLFVPRITEALFAGYASDRDYYKLTRWIFMWIYLYTAVLFYLVTCRIVRLKISDAGFAVSFLSTLPPNIAMTFSTYIEAYQTGDTEALSIDHGPFFNKCDTLKYLVEAILLVNFDNIVVGSSATARETLMIEEGADFQQLMVDCLAHFEFPPLRMQEADVEVHSVFVRVSVYPVKRLEYQGQVVSYVVKMTDIQELDGVIQELNSQANGVRLLAAHLVPWPVATQLVNFGVVDPPPHDGTKMLAVSFMITPKQPFDEDDLPGLQSIIADSLQANPDLTYMGRSLQMFRIVTGQFGSQISRGHPGRIVVFALDLIQRIQEYGDNAGKKFDIYCGIHSGPSCAYRVRYEITETAPIIYEPLSSPMSLSTLVAAHGAVNRITISMAMYQDIFGQGFDVAFHNEMVAISGELLQIYTAQRGGEDSDAIGRRLSRFSIDRIV